MRLKHKACCSPITSRSVVSVFSSLLSGIATSALSVLWPSLCTPGVQGASTLLISLFWLGFQNPGRLHTSTLLFLTSPIYGTTFQKLFCLTLISRTQASKLPSLVIPNFNPLSLLPPLTFPNPTISLPRLSVCSLLPSPLFLSIRSQDVCPTVISTLLFHEPRFLQRKLQGLT